MAERFALRHIEKSFGSVQALRGVDFLVRAGQLHALLGENGAGKTTLMRIAYGLTTPDAGAIEFDGHPTPIRSPRDARARGIGMVYVVEAVVIVLVLLADVMARKAGAAGAAGAARAVGAEG